MKYALMGGAVCILSLLGGCRYLWDPDFDDRQERSESAARRVELDVATLTKPQPVPRMGRFTIVQPTLEGGEAYLLNTETGQTFVRMQGASRPGWFPMKMYVDLDDYEDVPNEKESKIEALRRAVQKMEEGL